MALMNQWPIDSPTDRQPLWRRSSDGPIAGVAEGICRQTGAPAAMVRVFFVAMAAFGGSGFLLYLGAWLLMLPPENRWVGSAHHGWEADRPAVSTALGGLLIGFGVLLAMLTIDSFREIPFGIALLAFVGIVLLNRKPGAPSTDAGAAPPSAPAPDTTVLDVTAMTEPEPIEPDHRSTDQTTLVDVTAEAPTAGVETDDTAEQATGVADVIRTGMSQAQFGSPDPTPTRPDASTDLSGYGSNPADLSGYGSNPADLSGYGSNPADLSGYGSNPADLMGESSATGDLGSRSHWAVPRAADETYLAAPPRPPGPPLAAITLTAILAVVGVALVLNTLADVFVGTTTVTGIGLAIVGTAIASTSFRGRTLPLLPIAGVLSALLVISPVLDHVLTDGAGAQEITIGSQDELQPAYRLGAGSIELDLTDLELTEDVVVVVEVGAGAIDIRLPPDLPAEVQADVNVGYAGVLTSERAGLGSSLRVLPRAGTDPDTPRLILLTSVDMGAIDVYR